MKKQVIVQIEEEAFHEMQDILKKADEALELTAHTNMVLHIMIEAVRRNDPMHIGPNDLLHIGGVPISELVYQEVLNGKRTTNA